MIRRADPRDERGAGASRPELHLVPPPKMWDREARKPAPAGTSGRLPGLDHGAEGQGRHAERAHSPGPDRQTMGSPLTYSQFSRLSSDTEEKIASDGQGA